MKNAFIKFEVEIIMKNSILLALGLILLLSSIAEAIIPRYELTDISSLGSEYSIVKDINASGQIVGESYTSGDYHAFLWQNSIMTDLGVLGGTYSSACSINNRGQVVGESACVGGNRHAFLWENGIMTDLGTLGGLDSCALGINDLGQVVGWSDTALGARHAFLWQDEQMTDLGAIEINDSIAWEINNRGQIVGHSTATGSWRGTLWENGREIDLGTPTDNRSDAYSINNFGQVVGTIEYDTAFLWQDGMISSLAPIPGDLYSGAYGINDLGWIVGWSQYYSQSRATLWFDGLAINLNDTVVSGMNYELIEARQVNELGMIVGQGVINGRWSSYLLTPVPEPASISTLLFGIGVFAGLNMKRRRGKAASEH